MGVMVPTALATSAMTTTTTTTRNETLVRFAADATRLAANQTFGPEGIRNYRTSPDGRPRPTIITKAGTSAVNGDRAFNLSKAIGPSDPSPRGTSDLQTILDGNSMARDNSASSRPTSSQTHRLSPRQGSNQKISSPNIRQFAIPASQGSPMETLPAMQTSPAVSARSPNGRQNLPSLHSQLGDISSSQSPNLPMPKRQSFSSGAPLHSPPTDLGAMRGGPYTSLHSRANGSYPQTYPATEPSPASTTSAMSPGEQYRVGPNPRSSSPQSKYSARSYQGNGLTPQSDAPTPLSASTQPSLRTMSSESSPNEGGMMDHDRPILPPLTALNGPLIGGGFKCEHPGCTASPFQTQYLLNSHANVHSQNRPHYCPVKSCSRSEGGKGFKRKNEMIRHGLVHQSPGYICPFCPEREHKYPRPDNLLRHVRGHHNDKDKDDPQLREVLSQRPDGGSRGRRRRVNS